MDSRVDIGDDRGLEVWSRTFHVAPQVLVQLVVQFGPYEGQIRDALKRAEIGRTAGRQPIGTRDASGGRAWPGSRSGIER
jgi:hypothetical protein